MAIHYCPRVSGAFYSIAHISQDVNCGWIIRYIHANGASWFFILLYCHVGRGLYYGSYRLKETWSIGVIILVATMAAAFVGYVLVWGQIRFWGATVITNLLSAIPYIGSSLVEWVWGGFAVDNATLNRFFTFHFIIPFVLVVLAGIHVVFLHEGGSGNPLGVVSKVFKVGFHPYYSFKDLFGFGLIILGLLFISLYFPNRLGDPDNFIPANPLATPIHIKPEWYFLWAYAILRSVPNKLGGVLVIFSAILYFLVLPYRIGKSISFSFIRQILFWGFVVNLFLLTWIGGSPVESPYEGIGQICTVNYFILLISISGYKGDLN